MEVICSGLNVVDLLVTTPEEIPYGLKTECEKIIVQGGAPAGNAACGLAALGHQTGFIGYIGQNTLSQIACAELKRNGVSEDLLVFRENAQPAIAIVQIDSKGERTVLYSMNGYTSFSPDDLDPTILEDCKLVLVDGYDTQINTYLLRLARERSIPTILDIEAAEVEIMKEMVGIATHVILPLEAAQVLTGKQDPETVLRAASSFTEGQFVITDGANGSWALHKRRLIHQPSFKVEVVDTTGCGDAFHAGYGSALLQGFDLESRLRYASFFAAQVARHFGGRTCFPSREFMNKNFGLETLETYGNDTY